MTKEALLVLSLIALIAGLGWAWLSQQPVWVDGAVVLLCLVLGGLSWKREQ